MAKEQANETLKNKSSKCQAGGHKLGPDPD